MIGTSRSVWGFDPRSVPGCQLWLDGADSSTITLSTSKVTQWNDKSGNGYNFTQSTSGNQPTYSTSSLNNQNTITFTSASSNYLLGTASTNFIGTNSLSVYGVFKTNDRNSGASVFAKSLAGSAAGRILYAVRDSGNPGTILGGIGGQTGDYNALIGISDTYTAGAWRIFGFVSDRSGWINTTYQNGTSIGTATISSNTTTNLTNAFSMLVGAYNNSSGGANPPQPGLYLDGGVGELLVFSTALTTTQRQQVEGYLAHKWGLTTSIPSTHPFSSIRPHLRTFQPSDVPGCQLWLDGADQSSLTLSGSNVTQWNDKSGNGYNMNTIAGSSSTYWSGTPAYPTIGTSINGLQTVNFKAQSGLKQATTLDGVKNLFWVGRIAAPDGSGSAPNYFLLGHDSVYDWSANAYGDKFLYAPIVPSGINNASASLFTSDPNAVTNTAFQNVYLPSAPNVSLLSVSGITGTTRYQGICYDRDIHIGWCGDLAEVLIFSTALTTSQRQQVEGYLAHKWGVTTPIPSTHPFKSFPPASLPFSPRNISGLALWLDAADQSSMTLSGSSVTQWRDKSGNGNNSTSSSATYTTGINGLGSMNNPTISGPITNSGSSIVDFFIVATLSAAGGPFYNMLALNAASVGNYYGAGSLFACYYGGRDPPQFYAYMNGNLSLSSTGAVNTPYIFNAFQSGTTGTTVFNGTSQGAVATPGNTFTYTNYYIGAVAGAPAWLGNIGEILVFNSVLTTSQRQQVEGYLAQKWGLTTSLPATHPYKKLPA